MNHETYILETQAHPSIPYGVSQQVARSGTHVPALSHPPTLPLSGRGESHHAELA